MRPVRSIGDPCLVSKWPDSSLVSMDQLFDGNEGSCVSRGNHQAVANRDCFMSALISVVTQDGVNCDRDVTVATGNSEGMFTECNLTENVTNKCVYQCNNTLSAISIFISLHRLEDALSLCEIKVDV